MREAAVSRRPSAVGGRKAVAALGVGLAALATSAALAQDDGVQRMAREMVPAVERAIALQDRVHLVADDLLLLVAKFHAFDFIMCLLQYDTAVTLHVGKRVHTTH